MPHADIDDHDGTVVIATEFRDRARIKQVPGASFVRNEWHAPLSWGTCMALRGIFEHELTVGPGLVAWAEQELATRVLPSLNLRDLTDLADGDPRLYGFQRPGSWWLTVARHCILGDDMGTGKTVQVAAALLLVLEWGGWPYPLLAIVPNSTKDQWQEVLTRWVPDIIVHVVQGSATVRRKILAAAVADIDAGKPVAVIINWESARLHSRLAPYGSVRLRKCVEHGGQAEVRDAEDNVIVKEANATTCEVHPKELNAIAWTTVVTDECHRQADPKSKQTRATWYLQHQPSVYYRWGLTGTFFEDNIGDAWGLLHGVAPQDFPTRSKFIDRYGLLQWNPYGGLDVIGVRPDTRDELFRVLHPRYRRMPKSLVLRDLPAKVRVIRTAEMTPKQRRMYNEMEKEMLTRPDDEAIDEIVLATNNLTKSTRLLQFSSSSATVDEDGTVRLCEPSSKLDVMEEVLADLSTPLVVCAESRQLIELAAARLDKRKQPVPYRMIVGGMTNDQREAAKADWIAGHARVFFFTTKAGGEGLDGLQLQGDTIMFLQRSWSMLKNLQAEDRKHRIGATGESVTIIDVVAPGTKEVEQVARLYEKAERLEEINQDRARLAAAGLPIDDLDNRYREIMETPLW